MNLPAVTCACRIKIEFTNTKKAALANAGKWNFKMLFCEALLSSNPTISQILVYSGIGFCFVMSVLLIQSILTSILGKIFVSISNKQKKD